MADAQDRQLPGASRCVGCGGLTYRAREDQLCPRCAMEAEKLIEQIELDSLGNDLALLMRFDAYCVQRDRAKLAEGWEKTWKREPAFSSQLFDPQRSSHQPFATRPVIRLTGLDVQERPAA